MRPLTPADPVRVGPHEVLARLGAGGMGEVLLVRTPADGLAALKVVRDELAHDPEFRARFAREVRTAQRVRGPFTPAVLSADPGAAVPWMATEYVPGPTLKEAVRENGPFPEDSLRVLALGLARALQAIHATGLMHRDLKPGNVLLSPRGPQVIDFGIARAVEGTVLTKTGQSFGTPSYTSPEQVIGKTVGPAADVFSLAGVVVYAATGQAPFGSGKAAELMARVVGGRADLHEVPENLRPLLGRCLAKDPAERPTADELVQLLSAEPLPSAAHGWLPPRVHQSIEAHHSDTRAAVDAAPPTAATGPGPEGPAGPGGTRPQGSDPAPLTPPPGGRGRTLLIAGAAALAVATMVGTVGLLAGSPWPEEGVAGGETDAPSTVAEDSESSGEHESPAAADDLSPVFNSGLFDVAFAPDGESVYVAGSGRLVQVDWETGEELASIATEPNNLTVGTDGTIVATYFNALSIWGPDLEITHDFRPPDRDSWNNPSLTDDGTRLSVSAVDDGGNPLVQVWNLETGEVEFEFAADDRSSDPVINADGTLLYTNMTTDERTEDGWDRRATVWDLTTEEVVVEFPNDDVPDVFEERESWPIMRYAEFHPTDPSVLAVKTSDSDLVLYDLSTGEVQRMEAPEPEQHLYEIHFSNDGSRLAASGTTAYEPHGGHVWDTATGELLTDEPVEVYSSLAFHPDGEVIVSLTPAPDNDRFIVLDGETFEIRHEFPG
ncbi:serine/threonine-protein kinase [Nocardiopsis exhalans]|uniref:Serine/threonine-protein kinase n=1 Tax=Nocardiopsis exhalans TaxID=163604 RepID=A0ABY5D9Z3_9ACTN|nr:serine/threonine-protein kinase [Nocardiopsis exhalans]USY19962.1 serine/threonine-protein kinase [Nocardiopsis exhalans]